MKKKIILGIFSLGFTISVVNASDQNDVDYNNQSSENLFDTPGFDNQNQSNNVISSTRRNRSFIPNQNSYSVDYKRLSPEAVSIRENTPINYIANTPSRPVYKRSSVSPIENSSPAQFSRSTSLDYDANGNQNHSPVVTLNAEVQTLIPRDDQDLFLEIDSGRPNTPVASHYAVSHSIPKADLDLQKIEALKETYNLHAMSSTILIEAHLDLMSLTNKHLIDIPTRDLRGFLGYYNNEYSTVTMSPETKRLITLIVAKKEKIEDLKKFHEMMSK